MSLQQSNDDFTLYLDVQQAVCLQVTSRTTNLWFVQLLDVALSDSQASASVLGLALHALFDAEPSLLKIELALGTRPDLQEPLQYFGLADATAASSGSVLSLRAMLRQLPEFWLPQLRPHTFPLLQTMSEGKRHPLRAPVPAGEVYRRYVLQLNAQLSLRTVDPATDVDIFHDWMNNPRVARFWELDGDWGMHRDYLHKVTADIHLHPVFGCFDGQPFGYFELYWAKEDRIAPYYDVDDYDRGIHMLVGDEQFRGPHRVAAWLPSLAHFLFLDDPRTRHVVAEPRADNAKMIGYMQTAGFYKPKEFNFPHKRAAMMMLSREAFFDQFCL